jgi:cellulose 1,4-beta-cellobiosidase
MNSGHRIVGLVLAAALAAVAVPADGPPAGAAPIRAFCGRYQHVTVTTRAGTAFVVRNDFWGTRRVCLQNSGLRPNFRVTRTRRNAIHGKVMSFPYILRGCSWGVCSPKSRLPARVRSLRKPEASWRVFARARGRWNASLETWFGKRDMKTGQANGAELMIWLNTRNLPRSSTRRVRIDGTWWYLAHWKARGHGKTWHYIQFRRVRRTSRVSGLKLWPFIKKAEQLHLIKPRWWLLNIEAGFEIWNGGTGLRTKSFWARP